MGQYATRAKPALIRVEDVERYRDTLRIGDPITYQEEYIDDKHRIRYRTIRGKIIEKYRHHVLVQVKGKVIQSLRYVELYRQKVRETEGGSEDDM